MIRLNIMRELKILLPSLETQKKIVQKLDHILEQLEKKKKVIFSIIEQNKERIDFFKNNWESFIIDAEIENHPNREKWKKENFCSGRN